MRRNVLFESIKLALIVAVLIKGLLRKGLLAVTIHIAALTNYSLFIYYRTILNIVLDCISFAFQKQKRVNNSVCKQIFQLGKDIRRRNWGKALQEETLCTVCEDVSVSRNA